jgi:hypothetical protein
MRSYLSRPYVIWSRIIYFACFNIRVCKHVTRPWTDIYVMFCCTLGRPLFSLHHCCLLTTKLHVNMPISTFLCAHILISGMIQNVT